MREGSDGERTNEQPTSPSPKGSEPAMSNHPHRRQRRRRQLTPELTDLALAAALELAGCTCTPDVAARHDHEGGRLTVAHDHGCPAVTARPVVAIAPRRHRP